MDRLIDKEFREELAYGTLKGLAIDAQRWKEYRYDDGFRMYGPDDEETRLDIEEKHREWLKEMEDSYE